MGLILWAPDSVVVESDEGFFYVEEHVYLYLVTCIVPVQVNAELSFALPIMGDFLVLFEDSHEVLSMFIARIFYAKLFNA